MRAFVVLWALILLASCQAPDQNRPSPMRRAENIAEKDEAPLIPPPPPPADPSAEALEAAMREQSRLNVFLSDCEYNVRPATAVVADSSENVVRFWVGEELIPYERAKLPPDFTYETGAVFQVHEKRLQSGTCDPYVLEILGKAE